MTDKLQHAAALGSDLGREFEDATRERSAEDRGRSVQVTARAELTLAEEREDALERHDSVWVRERDRLSNSAQPGPSMDLGSRDSRNLLNEYEERWTQWLRGQDEILDRFTERRTDLRREGQTLSTAFEASVGGAERPAQTLDRPDAGTTDPLTRESEPTSGQAGVNPDDVALRNEFARQAPGPGRSR